MGTTPQPSERWTLNKQDINAWAKMTLAFFAPTLIVLLTALQSGQDLRTAATGAMYSLYASGIYLFKKFQDK